MANGSVVNVNAATHPDLAQAMRGSSNNFGIVTQFKAKVHHMGNVWGGSCFYDTTKADQIYAALHNFIAHGAEDPKAAIIFTDLNLATGIRSRLIFYFYDGPTPPTTGPFAEFLKINNSCILKTRTYSDLVSSKSMVSQRSLANASQLKTNGQTVSLLNARSFFRVSMPISSP